jgi:lipid-A-disaccharide synthase
VSAPEIYLVAGEASGDRHGAALIQAITRQQPQCTCSGVGGAEMLAAGQEQLFDLAEHAVVGLTDVLKNYFKFRRFYNRILDDIRKRQPPVVVLIDYPGMNLRLARQIRSRMPDIKIVYYISPQVWAWKQGRAQKMESWLDKLLVIFPFEEDWFREHAPRLDVEWVGHPTLDRWDPERIPPPGAGPPYELMLMPGSRKRELEAHLPVLLPVAEDLRMRYPQLKVSLLSAGPAATEQIRKALSERELSAMEIVSGYQLTHLSRSHLALVASGTATLECALAKVPMIVIYKAHPLTFAVGRQLVKTPYLSMVNILAGEKVVPEFLQDKAHPELLIEAAATLLDNPDLRHAMRQKLNQISKSLGEPGASERAAKSILQLLE